MAMRAIAAIVGLWLVLFSGTVQADTEVVVVGAPVAGAAATDSCTSNLLFSWTGEPGAAMITSLLVWGMMWYMCYWLYKNRIFIKI